MKIIKITENKKKKVFWENHLETKIEVEVRKWWN